MLLSTDEALPLSEAEGRAEVSGQPHSDRHFIICYVTVRRLISVSLVTLYTRPGRVTKQFQARPWSAVHRDRAVTSFRKFEYSLSAWAFMTLPISPYCFNIGSSCGSPANHRERTSGVTST